MENTAEIIVSEINGKNAKLGHIVLNRPKALNALSFEMCKAIQDALGKWEVDKNICAVIIKSSSNRAFCAGGDIRAVYQNPEAAKIRPNPFFQQEYAMNKRLYHFKKPYISFLDGITMGGGAGIALHGSYRIGTERLMFAMPETGIGFFPDIGSSDFLLKCPGKIGLYLALTGNILGVADAYGLGLVTHVVPSVHLEPLEKALLEEPITGHNDVTTILNNFHRLPAISDLLEFREYLDPCFSEKTVEQMMEALRRIPNEWAQNTASSLLSRSPTSLKVTLEHLRRAEQLKNFDDKMKLDAIVTQHFLEGHDFFEGIRAAVIDKNRPVWKPAKLSEVSDSDVEKYFL